MVLQQVNLDLADPAFWQLPPGQRLAAYRILRGLDAPARCGDGSYVLARHRDVVEASRRPDVFLSGPGVTTPRPPAWVRTVFGDSMVNMDDPRHARLRGVVSRAFTPRVLARIAEDVRDVARGIVADVVAERPTEFVAAVATRMPFEIICTMMGVPPAYRRELLEEIGQATEGTTVRRGLRVPGRGLRALARMHRVIGRVARDRRREPADDLISALAAADLTGRELGAFFSLLMVAGVETTRNAISHGLHLLSEHPDQRALLAGDVDRYAPGFVDEVVRHSSPIVQFRRTLARDHELGGHLLPAGADVVLCYASANRDETVFADPDRFDLTRHPNPHVGFGGGGPHFCLGTALARQEMTALFRELLTRLPDIRSVGEPGLVPSSFDNRVGRLSFTY